MGATPAASGPRPPESGTGPSRSGAEPASGAATSPAPGSLLPGDFRLHFDPAVRRPRPEVLVGGSPIRVLRLSGSGAGLVAAWWAGAPVGPGRAARRLATRLVDAGLAHPRPPTAGTDLRRRVVIPVRDDPGGLAATLAALRDSAPELAVVVVDDGSASPVATGDGSSGSGGPGPLVLRLDVNSGPAAARNAGWRHRPFSGAGGAVDDDVPDDDIPDDDVPDDDVDDVIVFVDAGVVPEGEWIDALFSHFADPGLAAVAPRIRSRPSPGAPAGLAEYELAHSPLDLGALESGVRPGAAVGYVPTALLAVRRAALEQLGGFDESLRFGEDVDLVWRLHASGWRVRYDPSVRATHPMRPSAVALLRQRAGYGRSAAALAARHGSAAAPLSVSPWSFAAWVLLASGWPLPAAGVVTGTALALSRRAGSDRATAAELVRLALTGNARAGGPIATAIRRAWLVPAVLATVAARRWAPRRTRRSATAALALALFAPATADWAARRPATGPAAWVAWSLADDLSYQFGVWSGAVRARSARALLPRR